MSVFGPYPAVVLTVHDGDTMRVDLDLGFGIHATDFACRVYGINAPELATDAGKVALAYALTLVKPGDKVTVLSHSWDKYGGRFDGQVTLADGTDFAAHMLSSGNAVVMK
jgi:endonuclease YncB( thermonuclease family)